MIKKLLTQHLLTFLLLTTITPVAYAQFAPENPVTTVVSASGGEEINTARFIRTELFFGRNKPDGTEVSEADFADFLSAVVTPEFPDGLTVLSGLGQFRDTDDRIIQEKSKVLILLYPAHTRRSSSRKIERIRTAYKNQFQQQSVLRSDDSFPVRVSF